MIGSEDDGGMRSFSSVSMEETTAIRGLVKRNHQDQAREPGSVSRVAPTHSADEPSLPRI